MHCVSYRKSVTSQLVLGGMHNNLYVILANLNVSLPLTNGSYGSFASISQGNLSSLAFNSVSAARMKMDRVIACLAQ